MKMTIEIDCTPQEARTFLGLPDLSGFNEQIVEEMRKRTESHMAALQPEEILKTWATFGGQAQEQMRKLMTAAAEATLARTPRQP